MSVDSSNGIVELTYDDTVHRNRKGGAQMAISPLLSLTFVSGMKWEVGQGKKFTLVSDGEGGNSRRARLPEMMGDDS